MSRTSCMVYLFVILAGAAARGEDLSAAGRALNTPVWRRWAIVATPGVRNSGVGDLLTARLSTHDAVELLERDSLESALRELTVAHLAGASATAERLEFGRISQADALICLDESKADDNSTRFLRMTICDVRHGARVAMELMPMDEAPDTLAATCSRFFDRVRRRFPKGVQSLIAIPPFVSHGLQHDFDHLQRGCAMLLASTLSQRPGIAVIAIEEARHILRELSINRQQIDDRIVPIVVQGDFTTDAVSIRKGIDLTVTVRDGADNQLKKNWQGLSEQDLTTVLRNDVLSHVLQRTSGNSIVPLTRKQQIAELAQRADALGLAGSYTEALGLHEAALLIDPDHFNERVAAVEHYLMALTEHRMQSRRNWDEWEARPLEDRQDSVNPYADGFEERVPLFQSAVRHLEFVIRRRMVNPREAAWLLKALARHWKLACAFEPDHGPETRRLHEQAYVNLFSQCRHLDPKLRDGALHPRVRRVDSRFGGTVSRPKLQPWAQEAEWVEAALHTLDYRVFYRRHCSTPGYRPLPKDRTWTLPLMRRLLTEWVTPGLPQPAAIRFVGDLDHLVDFPHDELRAFWKDLASTSPFNAFLARFAILELDIKSADSEAKLRALQKELEQLQAEMRVVGRKTNDRNISSAMGLAAATCSHARIHIERRLKPYTAISTVTAKPYEIMANHIPPEVEKPRLQFRPLGIEAWCVRYLRCNDDFDVLCHANRIDSVGRDLVPRRIFDTPQDYERILSVACDGEHVWIAAAKSGIAVVTPTGRRVAQFLPDNRDTDSEHVRTGTLTGGSKEHAVMPPYTPFPAHITIDESLHRQPNALGRVPYRNLVLRAIGPGRCVAMAEYGRFRRIWVAEFRVAPADEQPSCRVLHVASREAQNIRSSAEDDDPSIRFQMQSLMDVRLADRHLLLVGRAGGVNEVKGYFRRPVGIDLETGDVEVVPLLVQSRRGRNSFSTGGQLVNAGADGLDVYHSPDGIGLI